MSRHSKTKLINKFNNILAVSCVAYHSALNVVLHSSSDNVTVKHNTYVKQLVVFNQISLRKHYYTRLKIKENNFVYCCKTTFIYIKESSLNN